MALPLPKTCSRRTDAELRLQVGGKNRQTPYLSRSGWWSPDPRCIMCIRTPVLHQVELRPSLKPKQNGCRPDAASCPRTACAAACADALPAACCAPQDQRYAAASSPRCSSGGNYAASASARGNASRSSPCSASGTHRVSTSAYRLEPAAQTPCPAACRTGPQALPPHTGHRKK
jgi:hypothetical protein